MAANRVIGRDNALPWRLRDDLRRFRELTLGHPVIMGRKTYESILASLGKPLPGRHNIVVTRQAGYRAPGCEVASSLEEALAAARVAPGAEEIFVIGGAELYRAALPAADTLHVTEIHRDFEGDTRFPELAREDWKETGRETRQDGDLCYDFVTYRRV